MKSRVSSTVTKRKPNPRPRKYASASERQAAYRARAPEVCFRAEPKTVETLDRIAETLDQSRADVLLSMTKFALANHDWARFGLTHKPLPFEYGVNPLKKMTKRQEVIEFGKRMGFKASAGKGFVYLTNMVGWGETFDDWDQAHAYLLKAYDDHYVNRTPYPWDYKENPMKTTRAKRKPTPAQLAARERFAEMARSGAFAKGRKRNPAANGMTFYVHANLGYGKSAHFKVTASPGANSARSAANEVAAHLGYPVFVGSRNERPVDGYPVIRYEFIDDAQTKAVDLFVYQVKREGVKYSTIRKTNPARKAAGVRRNPSSWGTAPLKKVRSVVARSKTTGERRTFMMADSSGVKVPTPYDFGFRLEIEGEMFDFVGRYEGPLLIISEKSTGLRLPGDVGFTLRSSYGDDKNAAKRWTLDLIERVTPQKFAQKVRAAR